MTTRHRLTTSQQLTEDTVKQWTCASAQSGYTVPFKLDVVKKI